MDTLEQKNVKVSLQIDLFIVDGCVVPTICLFPHANVSSILYADVSSKSQQLLFPFLYNSFMCC